MTYLGIDIGSLTISLVLVDGDGKILRTAYRRHHGDPISTLRQELKAYPLPEINALVSTGSGAHKLSLGGEYIDAVVAQVKGVGALAPDARNIIYIGGGSFSLIRLDENGNYEKYTANSACASGTGAFLDQQALRLQIPPRELADRAMAFTGKAPNVATRCAVFAKSDMIHLQQEGYSTDAIAAGLCAGLGRSTVDGLLSGRKLKGKTVCIGGVARNKVVVASVRNALGVETVVPDNPELVGAFGAALSACHRRLRHNLRFATLENQAAAGKNRKGAFLRPPLALQLSKFPESRYHLEYVDENKTEVALLTSQHGKVTVTLGFDIGSTSTKAALLDNQRNLIAWAYRKTAGNPIAAVQKVLQALRGLAGRAGFSWDIRGVGTTGSGRKLIQAVIGADLAINEITAHARAAVFLDPEVDTILELGGQDAKFTQLQDGVVYNSIMNYVCAAGTGSFIEEQALKLGVPIEDFADLAMGVECPKTSDRCTVYMERDLDLLLARGWSKPAVAAAVLHSVRDNYLNKVVGGLYIGKHICFQGATARNRALVAAFESELGAPISVSPFCHVTGCIGMCLLVQERGGGKTSFKGLEFADEKVSVEYETCDLCHNRCNLSIIHTGSETVAWGLKCGRDYESRKPVVKKVVGYDYLQRRDKAWRRLLNPRREGPKIGLPRSLSLYGYMPLWRTFFNTLGCQAVISPMSTAAMFKSGVSISTAEYCAPVQLSHGHVKYLLEEEDVDYLFLPHMLREENHHGFTDSCFCAYVQAHPGVLSSIEGLDLAPRLIAPIVQLQLGEKYMVEKLYAAINPKLKFSKPQITAAYRAGYAAQQAFRKEALKIGDEGLEKIKRHDELGIVIVGRPYNALDPMMTLDLPRKIAEMGYPVLFLDQLRLDYRVVAGEHRNMYWHYGQNILAAAEYILAHDNLFGVYFTNFMCGPDSYIMTYFKETMAKKKKPYIVLQFDGHGADAGYLTRMEAALESFHAWKDALPPQEIPAVPPPARKAMVGV